MHRRPLLLPALALIVSACPPGTTTPDAGASAPVVTSVSPTSGSAAGGTSVTINGANFVSGSIVSFGALSATTTFEGERRLTAITPAQGPGVVDVTVTNPGGRSSTLAGAFTYSSGLTVRAITEAVLRNPAEATDTSGTSAVNVSVVGHVQSPMVTSGTGQGLGVRAQVGFATSLSVTPAASDFTWRDATYAGDVDGPVTGDKLRDAYSGTVALPSPTSGMPLTYYLAARFSGDDGLSWTIADRDGSANGLSSEQLSRITIARPSIDWCKLGGEAIQPPPTITLRGGMAGSTIYGQVFKANVTSMPGAGPGIKGALGYGAPGSEPSAWTWIAATFNADKGGGANDEFQALLPNPGPGTWKFAFRFSHADGPWSYCDADGLSMDGFTEGQAGTLTVQAAGAVDSCKLQFPEALTTYEGRPSEPVYGRVFVRGLTEAMGPAAGIEGEVGYGALMTAPSDTAWTWTAMSSFNIDDPGGGEEYVARLTGPAPGVWAYAFRFRLTGGPWTHCDKDGSTNGLELSQLGALSARPFDVSDCVLSAQGAAQTVLPSAITQPYTVQVTVPTLTDGPGQGTPLSVQAGSGALGSDPASWTQWAMASYAGDANAADSYSATIVAPATPGQQAVAFRVQVGSRPPVFCDLDGSQNGYQQAQAGRLTVSSVIIQSCRLATVSDFALPSGSPLIVTARALIPGVSASPGPSPQLRLQIGVGPQGTNASSSNLWGWQEAAFATDISPSGEDEFRATAYPAYTGNRAVSARASLDGVSWMYCDLNGSDVGGYEVTQQYDVMVNNHAAFDFCNTQAPAMGARGASIYGQIYEPGLTPNAATPFIAQLGIGVESEDPGLAWTWMPATFNVLSNNNNEYQRSLPADAGVGLRYAFRYSLDAGMWCFGDLNGSQDGFSGGTNIGLITP